MTCGHYPPRMGSSDVARLYSLFRQRSPTTAADPRFLMPMARDWPRANVKLVGARPPKAKIDIVAMTKPPLCNPGLLFRTERSNDVPRVSTQRDPCFNKSRRVCGVSGGIETNRAC